MTFQEISSRANIYVPSVLQNSFWWRVNNNLTPVIQPQIWQQTRRQFRYVVLCLHLQPSAHHKGLLSHDSNPCQPDWSVILSRAINSLPDTTLTNPERLLVCACVRETEQEIIITSTCSLIFPCPSQRSRNLILFRSDTEPLTPPWVPAFSL